MLNRRTLTISTIIALVLAISTIAATGSPTGPFAFLGQVQEYFGIGATQKGQDRTPGRVNGSENNAYPEPTGPLVDTVIAGWDLTGVSSPATAAATTFDTNLVATSGANNLTRGAGAAASTGSNSFRTVGFQNNGISTANTDYFQITLTTGTGFKQSLSAIDARYVGTATFAASPGVSSQYAYSLDGSSFTLIGSPSVTVGTPATQTQINLTGVSALQNVAAGTTIYIRYYASGQTTTGGWGFNSPAAGQNGLAITGSVTAIGGTSPSVTSPTATAITSTSATLGANVTSDGGNPPISARGTVWKTSTGVTATDNALAEGGVTTGIFTHSRTSLPAGTQIFYKGYATNGSGTGLSPEASFFTLSTEPTAHAASFAATPFSSSQIDLSFSAASTVAAAGYIVLRRNDGTFPDATGVTDAVAPGSLSLPVGTTLVTTISNNSATTFSNTGLTLGTEYRYALIPFGYNGANAATYNYLTAVTIPTAIATTATASSDVIAVAASESATISSIVNDAGPLTTATGVQVWQVTIRDGGAGGDPDLLPTTITALTIGRASGVSSFSSTILAADIFDGNTNLGSAVIGATTLSFTGLNFSVPDDQSKTLSIRISLKTSGLTDNQLFQFNLASAGVVTAGAVTSSQISAFTTIVSDITKNKIDVAATKLAFGAQPVNVGTGSAMTPAPTIYAADANGNTDVDYATAIDVTATGSVLTGSPVSSTPITGTASFSTLTFTTAASGVTLNAASGVLTPATSATFNVLLLPLPGEIVINQMNPAYAGASNEYVELVNLTNKTFDLSLLTIDYRSAAGGGTYSAALSGTLQPYSFWLLSPDPSITVGQTVALARDGAMTAGFAGTAGQLALRLAASPNTAIDGFGYGTITSPVFVEGTAALAPTSNSGYIRVPDGNDTNSNVADFQMVTNANIYLRNSTGRIVPAGVTLTAGSYRDVTALNNSSIGGDIAITGRLTLAGVVTTGANTISLGCNATVSGAGAASYVFGNVKKDFCGNVAFSYPVGQNGYTPVSVTITALGINPSSLAVASTDATLAGFNAASSLSRNWDLTETGDLTATLSFTYLDPGDVSGVESDYRVWRKEGNGTITDMCGAACVDTTTNTLGPVVGVTQFSRWTGAGPLAPTAGEVSLSGRVATAGGNGIRNASVVVTGNGLATPLRAITGAFGYYTVDGLTAGETYVVTVNSKRYTFQTPSRIVSMTDNVADADFTANP